MPALRWVLQYPRDPGSGVCKEARDGACMMYREMDADEGHLIDSGRHGAQGSRTNDSMQGVERVKAPGDTCTPSSSAASGKCEASSCNVLIGENTYCSKCSTTTKAPIDGVCKAISNDPSGCQAKSGSADGTCASCTGANYFLHKGGCYLQTATPGSTICKTAGSTAGICDECQAGYFKNPANSNQKDSCIACGDTTGDTTNGNKGVQNCATCTVEGAGTTGKTAKCTTCVDGYFANSDGSACGACDGNANCATCSGAATQCTSCKDTGTKLYFKKGDGETGECVAEADCNGNYFPNDDVDGKRQCIPCGDSAHGGIDGCTTCAPKTAAGLAETPSVTCSACNNGKKPNTTGTACVACSITDCASCDKEDVCAACDNGKYFTPTAQCVDDCGTLGGYYADGNVCKQCDSLCASCSTAGVNKCTVRRPVAYLHMMKTSRDLQIQRQRRILPGRWFSYTPSEV